MEVYWLKQRKSVIWCFLCLFLFQSLAQKQLEIKDTKLRVVVVGDIGVSETISEVKTRVVATIRREHERLPFKLGINLGGNVYPSGSQKGDINSLDEVFSSSFPREIFSFDFLTVLGPVDYKGDLETQFNFHQLEERFHLPAKNYFYGCSFNNKDVMLSDGTSIRFVCIDSTPIYQTGLSKNLILKVTSKEISDQIDILESWLDNSR
ncbi:hypothetical protein RF11_03408 [Thelohanellus kitauei]|uniref:Uncharacterized protein n=1 Tax=Thelohanellus kitauei TaxID=669202 RepID=A0A0C2N090_THEKT|nr:hypothetical protein RF11_03408 [Thelohanellus kitauei]